MVTVQLLAVYGLAFGFQQKIGPVVFRAARIPRETWGQREAAAGRAWPIRFFYAMAVCPYCTGFHAGWAGWLVFDVLPRASAMASAAVTWALAGAAACYLFDAAAKRLER